MSIHSFKYLIQKKYKLVVLFVFLLSAIQSVFGQSESVSSDPSKSYLNLKTEKTLKRGSAELRIGGKCDRKSLNQAFSVNERFLDLQSFAYRAAAAKNWSLIMCSELKCSMCEVKGNTIKEILDNYLCNTEFRWCLNNNCLYIAPERELSDFFKALPYLKNKLPGENIGKTFTGNFTFIELSMLCDFLQSVSGINITPVDKLIYSHVMMRVKDMDWKHLVSAIIFLNRYQISVTDFSVLILPQSLY